MRLWMQVVNSQDALRKDFEETLDEIRRDAQRKLEEGTWEDVQVGRAMNKVVERLQMQFTEEERENRAVSDFRKQAGISVVHRG